MSMKRLIVNADDFGLTRSVSQAIVRAHQGGIVTSTSLLANGEAFDLAVELARGEARLGVGIHLNLTEGKPVAKFPPASRLIDAGGSFRSRPLGLAGKIILCQVKLGEVEKEMRAQIEKILKTGLKADHIDSHKHIHLFPPVFELTTRLAREYRIGWIRCPGESRAGAACLVPAGHGARWKIAKQRLVARGLAILASEGRRKLREAGLNAPDNLLGIAETGFLDKCCLERLLEGLPSGTSEIMSHPGYADADLRRTPTRLLNERETEFGAMTIPEVQGLVARLGIELVTYRALADPPRQRLGEVPREESPESAEGAGARLVSR
jgi:hopanoid biosynthesis associated protein HpnK